MLEGLARQEQQALLKESLWGKIAIPYGYTVPATAIGREVGPPSCFPAGQADNTRALRLNRAGAGPDRAVRSALPGGDEGLQPDRSGRREGVLRPGHQADRGGSPTILAGSPPAPRRPPPIS